MAGAVSGGCHRSSGGPRAGHRGGGGGRAPRADRPARCCRVGPPILIAGSRELKPIRVGTGADDIVISRTLANTVTPIRLKGGHALPAIRVTGRPKQIALAANGRMAYVVTCPSAGPDLVDVISTERLRVVKAITVGNCPGGIAITSNGQEAYVANILSRSVTPVRLRDNVAQDQIRVGKWPGSVPISPHGQLAFVANEAPPVRPSILY